MEIPELLNRYNLNSRSALYKRLKAVNIELNKNEDNRVFANTEQLHILDDLHGHLERGGHLSNYSPLYNTHVVSVTSVDNEQYGGLSAEQQTSPIELLEKLVGAIASNFSTKSPIQIHQQLAQVEANEWLLTTTEVRELVGKKLSRRKGSDRCQIGGWIFFAVGKSGSQLLWRVEKVSLG